MTLRKSRAYAAQSAEVKAAEEEHERMMAFYAEKFGVSLETERSKLRTMMYFNPSRCIQIQAEWQIKKAMILPDAMLGSR